MFCPGRSETPWAIKPVVDEGYAAFLEAELSKNTPIAGKVTEPQHPQCQREQNRDLTSSPAQNGEIGAGLRSISSFQR
jgi:hypothetical protein